LKEAAHVSFRAPPTLDEHVAGYLTEQIVSGQLAPGQTISETGLARELGISKGPVREALHKLESRGLVQLFPRRSPRVTQMSPSYVGWLFDIMTKLCELRTGKAAENRTKEDLAQIRLALRKLQDCAEVGNVSGYSEAIFEFSSALTRTARNPLLNKMLTDLEPSARRVASVSLARRDQDLKKNVVLLEDVVRYIEAGDAEMASQAACSWMQTEKVFALNGLKTGKDDQTHRGVRHAIHATA
jgi:DNA-binding GntR family transcriptional regulator